MKTLYLILLILETILFLVSIGVLIWLITYKDDDESDNEEE